MIATGNTIREDDARAMVRLLAEVASLDGGHAEKKRALMDGLCELIRADAWVWTMGSRRQPGEPQVWVGFQNGGFSEERFAAYLQALENPKMGPIVAPFFAAIEESRAQVTLTRTEMDPEGAALVPGIGEFWEAADIGHLIMCGRPVDDLSISGIAVYRKLNEPDFSAREKQIIDVLLEEVSWLHHAGWPDRTSEQLPKLYPRQRVVLNLLIDGLSRKQIAEQMEISENTVAGYVRDVYKFFRVNSQPELMKKFLRGCLKSGGK